MRDSVVGDTNGASLGLGELGHGCIERSESAIYQPRRFWIPLTLPGVDNGDTIINNNITTLNIAALNQREVGLALLESNGPVNKVEIKVVELKLGQAGVQRGLDDLRAVLGVPQLGGLYRQQN